MPKLIESQAKVSLDKSIEQLDENIENQLAQIRRNALNTQPKTQVISGWIFERKSLVSAFSVVVLVFLFASDPLNTEVNTEVGTTIAPLLTQNELAEDPELLEDLEFIYWLSQEHEEV